MSSSAIRRGSGGDACKVHGGEIEQYRAKSYNDAPRPMKMGTIASLWRYDALASQALQSAKLRLATILRYAPRRRCADFRLSPRTLRQRSS